MDFSNVKGSRRGRYTTLRSGDGLNSSKGSITFPTDMIAGGILGLTPRRDKLLMERLARCLGNESARWSSSRLSRRLGEDLSGEPESSFPHRQPGEDLVGRWPPNAASDRQTLFLAAETSRSEAVMPSRLDNL